VNAPAHPGTPLSAEPLGELAPLLRRVVDLDPAALARLRWDSDRVAVLVWLPFGVLAGRTVRAGTPGSGDLTFRARELVEWFDDPGRRACPAPCDAQWRRAVPTTSAPWRRIDTVPESAVRALVRQGAGTLKRVGEQPRAAQALLDAVVLTVTDDDARSGPAVAISLRTVSALLRMGFVPRGSDVAVDVAGRWVRLAAEFGSVYAERPGLSLSVRGA
jgi:hypothetical protein